MSIVAFVRRLGRKLMPPGNRGSLDTEYRQPSDAASGDAEGPHPPPGGAIVV